MGRPWLVLDSACKGSGHLCVSAIDTLSGLANHLILRCILL